VRLRYFVMSLAVLSACADFPQLDSAVSADARNAPYPTMQPIDDLLGISIDADTDELDAATKSLRARATALKRRAAALRRPVISAALKRRMAQAVERHNT